MTPVAFAANGRRGEVLTRQIEKGATQANMDARVPAECGLDGEAVRALLQGRRAERTRPSSDAARRGHLVDLDGDVEVGRWDHRCPCVATCILAHEQFFELRLQLLCTAATVCRCKRVHGRTIEIPEGIHKI
jgi:hypothetical protein